MSSKIPVICLPTRLPRKNNRPNGVEMRNVISICKQPPVKTKTSISNTPEIFTPDAFYSRKFGLGLLCLNVRSLVANIAYIKTLILRSKPDVFVATESWLKSHITDSQIILDGYRVFRCDRAQKKTGGGVAIYVKSTISVDILLSLSVPNQFECLIVRIKLGQTNVVIAGIYRPPRAPPSAMEKLSHILSDYAQSELLVTGDMNSDWLSNSPSTIKEACANLNLTQLIKEFTRPNLKNLDRSTLIDIILTNRPHKYTMSGVLPLGFSDHCPVVCIRDMKAPKTPTCFITKRNFKNFCDQAFLHEISSSDLCLAGVIPDPDLALHHLATVFNNITDKFAPFKRLRIKNRSNPWFTNVLSTELHARDRAWRAARKSKRDTDWQVFRRLRNKCRLLTTKAKSEYYFSSLVESEKNPSKFWKIVSSLNSGPAPALPHSINTEAGPITDKHLMCNFFNQHFIAAGNQTERSENTGVVYVSAPDSSISTVEENREIFSFKEFTMSEVLFELSHIDVSKSTGEDNMVPSLLKLAAPLIAQSVTNIFNMSVASGTIPIVWKSAHVSPLFKGGDASVVNNYRPISKLSCLAKILETLIKRQLCSFLTINNILNTSQSGFRPGHSTITATSLVINDITTELDRKQKCAAIFIDLAKAFDTVDHAILVKKLASIGLDSMACSWFQNYLTNRTQAITVGDVKSNFLEVRKGVPQGSILGPILFTIYINDISKNIHHCKSHFYADDTVLYTSAPTSSEAIAYLQSAFYSIQNALEGLKLSLNVGKTKYILFSNKTKTETSGPILSLSGAHIEQVSTYKYLGIWLDEDFSFKTHITNLAKKIKPKIGFLYRNRSCFSKANRKRVIQATIMPILDYGDILYMHTTDSNLKSLDTIYHSALRFITGANFRTHHCTLYTSVEWSSLALRRKQHLTLFTYKALIGKLPLYLTTLLNPFTSSYGTRSQDKFLLKVPKTKTKLGDTAFRVYAPCIWNEFQMKFKLDTLVSLPVFKRFLADHIVEEGLCTCVL